MIRHSSSFFVSILFHITLALALFYGYKSIIHIKEKQEKKARVKISLCNIQSEQKTLKKILEHPPKIKKVLPTIQEPEDKAPEQKIIPLKKTVPIEKIIPKKQKQKTIKKAKITPKIKEKPKPKKELEAIKKPMPIKSKEIVKKETLQEIKKSQEIAEPIQLESKEEKNVRLQKDYINEHIQEISKLLRDNLYYPRSARKRGITGSIVVKFKLQISGEIGLIEIVSSNSEVLSGAAIKTIQNIAQEFPKPSQELLLHVPINYTLSR